MFGICFHKWHDVEDSGAVAATKDNFRALWYDNSRECQEIVENKLDHLYETLTFNNYNISSICTPFENAMSKVRAIIDAYPKNKVCLKCGKCQDNYSSLNEIFENMFYSSSEKVSSKLWAQKLYDSKCKGKE